MSDLRTFEDCMNNLLKAAKEVAAARAAADVAKDRLKLLNATDLRRMGLTGADIKQIPRITPLGRATPKYQAGDVEAYMETRKKKPAGL